MSDDRTPDDDAGDPDPPADRPKSELVVDAPGVDEPIELDAPIDDLPCGANVGRFVILGKVSTARTGIVYAAFDPRLDRKVALELIPVDAEDPLAAQETCSALVRDVMAAASVDHPNVVTVFDVGIFATGVFVAMEFVSGINLRQWMEARDDPFPWPEVLRVFRDAGRGLAAAHTIGVAHRDFKPDNVIMAQEGRICVIDFGLAPPIAEDTDEVTEALRAALPATLSSMDSSSVPSMATGLRGTVPYMSPEQHAGGRGDPKSDQFAFCVAFYEVLYGERPFKGEQRSTIALEAIGHRVRDAPRNSDVPQWLRAVLLKGLSPRRAERFPSMESLLRELDHDPSARRRRWTAGVAGLLGAGALAVTVVYLIDAEKHQCDADPTALRGIWDSETQGQLQSRFRDTGRPHAAETWAEVRGVLDGWAEQWLDYRVLACRATREWGSASPELRARRDACLDVRLHQLNALTTAYLEPSGPMVDHAIEVVSQLDPPSACATEATLIEAEHSVGPDTSDNKTLLGEAIEIRIDLISGNPELARARAEELRRRVEPLGAVALTIETELIEAHALAALGDISGAKAAFHRAAARANAADLKRLLARAWLDLSALEAADDGQHPLIDYTAALVSAIDEDRLRAELSLVQGDRARAMGRDSAALGLYHRAIELAEGDPLAPEARATGPLVRLGVLAGQRKEWSSAERYLDKALNSRQRRLGAQHPSLIEIYIARSDVAARRGALDLAAAELDGALTIALANQPGAEKREARLRVELGALQVRQARHQAANEQYELALRALEGGSEPQLRLAALRGKGSVLLAMGKRDEAATTLRQALDATKDDPRESAGLAPLTEDLAHALWDADRHDRSIALMVEARRSYAAGGPQMASNVARVDTWLEGHASPAPETP